MLVTDGIGIFASYTIAQYYKPARWTWSGFAKHTLNAPPNVALQYLFDAPIVLIFLFFYVLSVVFAALAISDLLVISQISAWATLPIVRGLAFRGPLTLIELWIIKKQHVR